MPEHLRVVGNKRPETLFCLQKLPGWIIDRVFQRVPARHLESNVAIDMLHLLWEWRFAARCQRFKAELPWPKENLVSYCSCTDKDEFGDNKHASMIINQIMYVSFLIDLHVTGLQ